MPTDLPTVRAVEPHQPAAEDLPHMPDQDDCGVEPEDHGLWTEDATMDEDETLDENYRWLHEGAVAPALRARVKHFTEPGPVARHVLNLECASCGSCKLCNVHGGVY